MLSCTAEEVGGPKAWLLFLLACASVARLAYTHSSTERGSVCVCVCVCVCIFVCEHVSVCAVAILFQNCLNELVSRQMSVCVLAQLCIIALSLSARVYVCVCVCVCVCVYLQLSVVGHILVVLSHQ